MVKIRKFAIILTFMLTVGIVPIISGCAPAPPKDWEIVRIGIMLSVSGGEHDSYNYAAIEGLKKAYMSGIPYHYKIPEDVSEMEDILRNFAVQEMDLIISVGSLSADALTAVAREFPEKRFAIIDSMVDLPNVASLVFREHEGSFLVGALAALMTQTGTVGFVGGTEMPFMQKFQAAFEHGVEYVNRTKGKSVNVLTAYAGTSGKAFRDPAKGREIALSHMDAGADIVYHVSGRTGIGVFEAAVERKKIALGVIPKRNWYAPSHVMASMLKRLDLAVFDLTSSVSNIVNSLDDDTFMAGTIYFGVTENGIGITSLDEATDARMADIENDAAKKAILQDFKNEIPDEVTQTIKAFEQKIADGEIVVRDALR